MKLWRIVVDIREAATDYAYPVVRHTFYGKTEREARRYLASHYRSDSFLRECMKEGRFGDVKCRTTVKVIAPS